MGNATTTGSFAAADTLYVQQDTGRVGIGTASPSGSFGVAGTTAGEFYIGPWATPILKCGSNNIWIVSYSGSAGTMTLYNANTPKISLHANGDNYHSYGFSR